MTKAAFHRLGLSWFLKTPSVCLGLALATLVSVAAPVHFLMAKRPAPCELGAFWHASTVSYVVPLESAEDIAHAREVIRGGAFCRDRPSLRLRAAPSSDGLNRNYLVPNAPFWDWHITQVDAFLYEVYFPLIFDPLAPAPHTLHDPEVMAKVVAGGGWIDQSNTIVAELDPILIARMQANAAGDLVLMWDNLGAFYAFTVEYRDTAIAGHWQPVPAVTWPIRENSWTIPAASLTTPARLYRVRAGLKMPDIE